MRFLNDWLLTILLLVPAIGGLAVPFVRPARAARRTAVGVTLATFCLSLLIVIPFRRQQGTAYDYAPAGTVQMLRSVEVFPALHAGYRVALDGLSFPFVMLTTFLCAILVAAARDVERPRIHLAMLLWLEASTLGAFVAFDLLLLWAFLALVLVPCCALIWLSAGAAGRARATISLLVPMLVALACVFAAVLGERLMSRHCLAGGTLDLVRLAACNAGWGQRTLFALALIGFVMRLPVVPFHSWLNVIATEASPAVAAMIGALIPLTGGYGLFRVVLPLFPAASAEMWWVTAGMGLLTVFYHSLAAIAQPGLGRAVVNLNGALAGFVLIGVATFSPAGANGAVLTLLAGSLAAALMHLIVAGRKGLGAEEIAARSGSGRVAAFAVAMLTLLTAPGLLGQILVAFGAFQAAERDSILLRLRIATPGFLIACAGAICLGTFLFGVACVQTMGSLTERDRSTLPAQPVQGTTVNSAVVVPLTAALVLLGSFVAPCCFAFTCRAIAVLLHVPG